MREVGVHLHDPVGAVLERPPEAFDVRRTEPLLARAMQDGHERKLAAQPVGKLAGAVRRGVVDHEQARLGVHAREHLAEPADDWLEVRPLVVGRQTDDQAHPRIIARVAQTLPSNAQLAEQFELLADLLELDGADAFRLSAYRRAATRIRESAVPVAQLALDKKATRLSGIGATIEGKIVEYTETGDLAALAKLRDKLPLGSSRSCTCPASGRRPRASCGWSWAYSQQRTFGQPPSRGGSQRSRASGRRPRRKCSPRSPSRGRRSSRRLFSGASCPPWTRRSRNCVRIRLPCGCPRPAAFGGAARPCGTSTSSPPPTIRPR